MPSSSYIRGNDYQVANFQPYELPYQAIMQEFATKRAYWEQGVAKIKQQYQNVVDLNPRFKENKQYLKDFIDKANVELQKVGKTDLSLGDNIQAASNIFKPLYDTNNDFNAKLLEDSETNKHYALQEVASENAKKNGTWNADNDFYWKSEFKKYKDAADRGDSASTIDKYYQNKKSYIPYYDFSKEYDHIMKLCHEDKTSNDTVEGKEGQYISHIDHTGVSFTKAESCLEMLSGNAKRQIGINAYAKYYNNREGLVQDYENLIYKNNQTLANTLIQQIAAAKTKKDDKLVEELQSKLNKVQSRVEEGKKEIDQMLKKDPNWYENNFEQIAANVGFAHHNTKMAEKLSWDKVNTRLAVNAVWTLLTKAQIDEHMLEKKAYMESIQSYQDHIYKMQENSSKSESSSKDASGKSKGDPYYEVDPTATAAYDRLADKDPIKKYNDDKLDKYDKLIKTYENVKTIVGNRIDRLPANIKDFYDKHIKKKNPSIDDISSFIDMYNKVDGKNDPVLTSAINEMKDATISWRSAKERNESAENKAIKNMQLDNKKIVINIADKLPLTEKDVFDLLRGKKVKGYVYIAPEFGAAYLKKDDNSEISLFGRIPTNNAFDAVRNKIEIYNETLTNIYKTTIKPGDQLYTTGDIDEKDIKITDGKIKNRLSQLNKSIYQFNAKYRDADGSAYVEVLKKVGTGEDATYEAIEGKELKNMTDGVPQASIQELYLPENTNSSKTQVIKITGIYNPLENYMRSDQYLGLQSWINNNTDKKITNGENSFHYKNEKGEYFKLEMEMSNGKPHIIIYKQGTGKYEGQYALIGEALSSQVAVRTMENG